MLPGRPDMEFHQRAHEHLRVELNLESLLLENEMLVLQQFMTVSFNCNGIPLLLAWMLACWLTSGLLLGWCDNRSL